MKIKTLFFAAAAIILAASCQKATPESSVIEGDGNVIFNVTVGDDSNKAVGKTAWAAGDKIVCFFKGDCNLGHQLRLTYDGTKWAAALDDPSFASSLLTITDANKFISAAHWDGTMEFKEGSDNTLESKENFRGKALLMKKDIPFTVTKSGETIIFSATIAMERYSNFQFVFTDLTAPAGEYTLSVPDNSLKEPYQLYFNSAGMYSGDYYGCNGQANADGVAFLGHFENSSSDAAFILQHPGVPATKHIKIISEGLYAAGAMTGAFKTSKANCWEVTDTTDYVCDTQNHCYRTVKLKDGKWWMADNMRLIPSGITPSNNLENVRAGIYYPVVFNGTAAAFSTEASVIGKRGYLYQSETALGLSVGGITTETQAKALEGCQGICPKGWHIPTISDITGLVGKAVSPISTVTTAPYYNGSDGSIALLNQDKFNVEAYGAVSIQDATKTAATLTGYLTKYPGKISSGYLCGSSFSTITYNTADGATSGIKNIQFYGFLSMTNKATEAEYTFNGAKLSYFIGAAVRCVKNAE